MKSTKYCLSTAMIAALASSMALSAADVPQLLLAVYNKREAVVREPDGSISQRVKLTGSCQDAWMLDNGGIAASGGDLWVMTDADGKPTTSYTAPALGNTNKVELHNGHLMDDGSVWIAEGGNSRLVHVGVDGKVAEQFEFKVAGNHHGQFRSLRKTDRGTFWLVAKQENTLYELDKDGKVLRKITPQTMKRQGVEWRALHSAVELENGNLFVGGGYNSSFCEITPEGKVVWELKNSDLPDINMTFCAGAEIQPDGTMVLAIFNSSHMVIAVNRDKDVLWAIEADDKFGRPTHVQVLKDGKANNKSIR
ncbi:hypothetical protein [Persicirhabdus sediminis]|uniref:PQQ-like domain-containing protein n=1 Tax=Persicirhabdus sediminis TaxID=454144 RepID=A0A8J7MDV9_9BACT|nr:hypothetical protein [Persicirhabdus sediminis]MBK1790723.1 hypothetical protein [Persicirhabdus sediminis]